MSRHWAGGTRHPEGINMHYPNARHIAVPMFAAACAAGAATAAYAQRQLSEIEVTGRQDALERLQLDTTVGTGSRMGGRKKSRCSRAAARNTSIRPNWTRPCALYSSLIMKPAGP